MLKRLQLDFHFVTLVMTSLACNQLHISLLAVTIYKQLLNLISIVYCQRNSSMMSLLTFGCYNCLATAHLKNLLNIFSFCIKLAKSSGGSEHISRWLSIRNSVYLFVKRLV
jgi:hypothetical protein